MRLLLWLLLLGAPTAGRADPAALEQLAPTQAELEEALAHAEAAASRAAALQEASLLLQNALGAARARTRRLPVCEDPELTSVVARARVFGAAWRDAAQRLRVEAARLEGMAARGTAAIDGDRLAAVLRAADEGARSEALASTWHASFVETAFVECGPPLDAAPGLRRAARAAGEAEGPVAVHLSGGGFLCPGLVAADGRVAVVDPRGCISRSACSCEPAALLPGAVIRGSGAP